MLENQKEQIHVHRKIRLRINEWGERKNFYIRKIMKSSSYDSQKNLFLIGNCPIKDWARYWWCRRWIKDSIAFVAKKEFHRTHKNQLSSIVFGWFTSICLHVSNSNNNTVIQSSRLWHHHTIKVRNWLFVLRPVLLSLSIIDKRCS